jgi:hypothetical protein
MCCILLCRLHIVAISEAYGGEAAIDDITALWQDLT